MTYLRLTVAWRPIASVVSCALAASGLVLSAAPVMAGCNSGNLPQLHLLDSFACQADAPINGSTAIGLGAKATGASSTALGQNARALGHGATAIGVLSGAAAVVDGATTLGSLAGSSGSGVFSVAIGAGSVFLPEQLSPSAKGDYSIAIGGSNDKNTLGARANGYRSIAIGQASVTADFGTALGFKTTAVFASTAVGTDAQATADSSSAFGRFAKASAASSLALGQGAVAFKARAVAIGSGSLANVADTVSVGTATARRRIVNLAHGVGNTDAATLGQVKAIATAAAETANADLQRDVAELRALVKQQQQELAALKGQKTAALNQ